MSDLRLDPYCGLGPAPGELFARWNLDPWLLAALAAAGAAYGLWARRAQASRGERLAFAGGMAALLLAFVSPICAWSSSLFAVRVSHHLLIVVVAAPLLAWSVRPPQAASLGLATVAQAAILWLWHAPGPYAWALSGAAPYWLMETTLLGASVWFWLALRARGRDPLAMLAGLVASTLQTGLLGALITFAPTPVYEPHFATTLAWGLTPLADQQLAGVIMWAPGSLPYLLAALALLGAWLTRAGRPAAA